ncbi:MAG TPA: DNA sulfur modification protein DndD [Pirellulales bacterium]|nr:DNA sulfur modification protein DndD [Pirellulales bacterium]
MILEQLTLDNFCLYRGRQVFDLSPGQSAGKALPIVLFGGINGGGKTTLLDAIQLALYGPRAKCSKRAKVSYEEYLRECIHRDAAAGKGGNGAAAGTARMLANSATSETTEFPRIGPHGKAAVAISFRYTAEGQAHTYEVERAWQVRGGKLRETLAVSRDGVTDRWLSDNWQQAVEELVPLGISQLFFFDAEKIRFLAEDETASEALGAAIKSLLGLDLAERLIADATVLEGRLAKKLVADDDRAQLEDLEREVAACDDALRLLTMEEASLKNEKERTANQQEKAEKTFAGVGGKHYEEREARKHRQNELAGRESQLKGQLLALATGELPLALAPELLRRVVGQDRREQQAAEAAVVGRMLEDRDQKVLTALKEQSVPANVLKLVREVHAADRLERQTAVAVTPQLRLSDNARALARKMDERGLAQRQAEARRLLDELAQVTREREDVERSLAATPQDEGIKNVVERLQASTVAAALAAEALSRMEARGKTAALALKEAQHKRDKLLMKRVEAEILEGETARMNRLAARTRATMQEFLKRATAAKIDNLSSLVTESFRFLLRKQTLVEQIMIDPATFAITLFGGDGQAISKQRLSEGEKQIFAISVLWGLARASARSLPAIIDTPMARLDAKHREHLIERYFPNASHQVIVLSTDTEVDRRYYDALAPSIARAYHLNYHDDGKFTLAEEGYFWEPVAAAQ